MPLPPYARAKGRPAIFMEITQRDDVGANLHAPKADEAGGGHYRLIEEVASGDTVLHYHSPSGGIIAISRATNAARSEPIVWAARGRSARSHNLDPYERPGWLVPLAGYTSLNPPTTQDEVIGRRQQIFDLREDLERDHGRGLHFPYYRYGSDALRTHQAYMAVVPRQLVALFPPLDAQVARFESLDRLPRPPDPDPDDPELYVADVDAEVNRGGQAALDPEAMTKAVQAHARLQMQLRDRVLAASAADHGNSSESITEIPQVMRLG